MLRNVIKYNGCTEESLPTSGILEMGGASTQIAFLPNGNVLADKFPVRIGNLMYSLYVHSYLNYGQNAVVKSVMRRLQRDKRGASIENPCMMTGKIRLASLTLRFKLGYRLHVLCVAFVLIFRLN